VCVTVCTCECVCDIQAWQQQPAKMNKYMFLTWENAHHQKRKQTTSNDNTWNQIADL